jgi:hypothetical protein
MDKIKKEQSWFKETGNKTSRKVAEEKEKIKKVEYERTFKKKCMSI